MTNKSAPTRLQQAQTELDELNLKVLEQEVKVQRAQSKVLTRMEELRTIQAKLLANTIKAKEARSVLEATNARMLEIENKAKKLETKAKIAEVSVAQHVERVKPIQSTLDKDRAKLEKLKSKLDLHVAAKALAELKVSGLALVKAISIQTGKTFTYRNRLYIRIKAPENDLTFVYAVALNNGFGLIQLDISTLVKPIEFEITNLQRIMDENANTESQP